jgi:hypothetical protein
MSRAGWIVTAIVFVFVVLLVVWTVLQVAGGPA